MKKELRHFIMSIYVLLSSAAWSAIFFISFLLDGGVDILQWSISLLKQYVDETMDRTSI